MAPTTTRTADEARKDLRVFMALLPLLRRDMFT